MRVNRYISKKTTGYLIQACLIMAIVSLTTSKAVSQNNVSAVSPIKIGLLIQDSTYTSAIQGAKLAVSIANEKGGMNGRKFQLVVRSMEGPWGTGSKQAVDLIFEEKVSALLGSHDGRNAHLVEQAATKSTVVMVSAWSSDPTLSQAFVPWFFNCVPNDNQQSAALIDEIYNKRKYSEIVIVHDIDYDSQTALNNFLKSIKIAGRPDPLQLNYQDYTNNLTVLAEKTIEADPDCIVIFCQPQASLKVIQQFRQKKLNKPLFGSLMLLNENELSSQDLKYLDNLISVPSGDWSGKENQAFRQEFQKIYGRTPSMVASFSFDSMNVLIEAIKKAGSSDREKIQKSLKSINYKGVTGPIQFDEKGNRIGSFAIMKTKNGVPITSD
jgi:branched-chain amino acid transport system substrate-binding protein